MESFQVALCSKYNARKCSCSCCFFFVQFEKLKVRMKLREQHRQVKFMLSDESLQLLPEYEQRIQVSSPKIHRTVKPQRVILCSVESQNRAI